METIGVSFNKIAAIVAGFVMIIAAIYAWVLPEFFHGYKTYCFFVVGVIAAAVLSGYYTYRSCVHESMVTRWLISTSCAVVVAALVAFFSLLIILNTRGS